MVSMVLVLSWFYWYLVVFYGISEGLKNKIVLRRFREMKCLQNEKQLQDLFYEINPDLSISKSTLYPSGNIKILPKATSDYLLMKNFAFSSTIYRITKQHMTIGESTHSFSN